MRTFRASVMLSSDAVIQDNLSPRQAKTPQYYSTEPLEWGVNCPNVCNLSDKSCYEMYSEFIQY